MIKTYDIQTTRVQHISDMGSSVQHISDMGSSVQHISDMDSSGRHEVLQFVMVTFSYNNATR